MFAGRSEELDLAAALVAAGTSVDVVGARASGRTAFLRQLANRLGDDGWAAITIRGVASLREQPFAAMHLAGVGAPSDVRGTSTLQVTAGALLDRAERPRSVLFIDDWDDLDETSWGVAESVRRATGLPMVRTRLQGRAARHTPTGLTASNLDPVIVVEMTPMRFEELEEVVEGVLGGPAESGTMSRLYSKSGGSIGLALSMAEVALREGRIQRDEEGRWAAVRDLWSPALSAMMEVHLENIGPAARDALETIALVGVADLETVRRLVDWDALEQLEERSMITLVPSGDRQLVTVIPPLLVEFFRHQPVAVRRVRITELIIDRLGTSDTIGAILAYEAAVHRPQAENDAILARLLRERDRARRIVTAAEWTADPSPATAVRFVSTLLDAEPADPAIAEVMTKTDAHIGEAADRAEFAVLRARWTAYIVGDVDAALASLESQSEGMGDYAPLLQAERVAIVAQTGGDHAGLGLPDDEAVVDGPVPVHVRVLEVRMLLQLARGEFDAVKQLFARITRIDPEGTSHRARIYAAEADIALGSLDAAVAAMFCGLDEARGQLDVGAIRAYSATIARALVVAGDYEGVDAVLDTVFAAGDPPPVPPPVPMMLFTSAAVVAIRRGNAALGERYANAAAALRFDDGPLPVQAKVMAAAQLRALTDPSAAASMLWELAEREWANGNRYAASYSHLVSLEIEFSEDRAGVAVERVGIIGGRLLVDRLAYVLANHAKDPDALLGVAAELESSGQVGLALSATRTASMLFTDRRQSERAREAIDDERRLLAQSRPRRIHTERFSPTTHALSEREREVARLAIDGLSNPEIAARLVISVRTVESHIHHVMRKLDVSTRQALRFYAGRV